MAPTYQLARKTYNYVCGYLDKLDGRMYARRNEHIHTETGNSWR
jgi:hypothetical protein